MTDAEKILDSYQEAQRLTSQSVAHGKAAVMEYWRCGCLLAEQKLPVPHGQWEQWVVENVPAIGLRTVQKLLKLSETKKEALEKVTSIRQAYILSGAIPEPRPRKPKETEEPHKPGAKVKLTHVQRQCLILALDKAAPEGEQEAAWVKLRESLVRKGVSGYDILQTMSQN